MAKKNINEILENVIENLDKLNDKQLEELNEAFTLSIVQRSREAKLKAATAAIAVKLAKKNNDPLYHKLIKFRKLWKETKDRIVQKYGPQAYQQWVRNQANKK